MRRGRVSLAAVAIGAAAAGAALAGPARAYVRTSDPNDGVEVAWQLPIVSYDFSSALFFPSPSCAPNASGDPAEAAVRASFSTWNDAECAGGSHPGLRLAYGGRIPEIRTGIAGTAENVVVIRRGWCSQSAAALADPGHCMDDPDVDCGNLYDCYEDDGPADRSTVALTTVLYDPATGRLLDADMEVNGWDGQGEGTPLSTQTANAPNGFYFTCDTQQGRTSCATYGQAGCNGYDLQNTVTHEAGHFIGLAHPCGDAGTPACDSPLPAFETVAYRDRTMYPATAIGETSKRTLSPDDVAGVCAIYPKAPGGIGCASGGAGGALAALLALLALRPRTCPPERRRGRIRR